MPVSHSIDPERRLVLCVGTGVLSDEDSIAGQRALASDPDFDPTYNMLFDFRGVASLKVSATLPHRITADHIWADGAKRAFLANTDESFGVTRMYEMLSEEKPGSVRVFRELEDALRWLELDGDDASSQLLR